MADREPVSFAVIALLERKATAGELDDYRLFVTSLANRVAGAKQGGHNSVNEPRPRQSPRPLRPGKQVPVLGPAVPRPGHVPARGHWAVLLLQRGESGVAGLALAVPVGFPLAGLAFVPEVVNHALTVTDAARRGIPENIARLPQRTGACELRRGQPGRMGACPNLDARKKTPNLSITAG
jgi:hypothetical protein